MYSTPPIHSNLRPLRSYDRYAHVTSPTPRAVMAAPRAMLGPVMPGVRRTLGQLRGGVDAPGAGPDPPPRAGYCFYYCTTYTTTAPRATALYTQLSTALHSSPQLSTAPQLHSSTAPQLP